MSDNASDSSLPTSPATNVPDLPLIHTNRVERRQGPGSVFSETTEGYGDYSASNANLPFSFSSASLALAAVPQEWSSAKHGFHAISTVVNSPHKRAAPPKAHSAIPAVTQSVLPRPNRKILDHYVQTVAPEWEGFQRSLQLGLEGSANIEVHSGLSETPRTPRGRQLPSLETIPSIFFESQFNLGDQNTFNAVTDQQDGEEPSDPSSLSHSLPLLEKLSHYADTLEQHLVREVSLRSSSFFAALSNLQDLQTESEQCIDRITQLRTMLKEVDDKNAKQGLEIVRMESKLYNLESVKDGVRAVSSVVEMTGLAKGLAAAGQWGEALGAVEELQALWAEESPTTENNNNSHALPPIQESNGELSPVQESPVAERGKVSDIILPPAKPLKKFPLSSLHAFSSLPSHLQALTMEIATSLSNELVNVLRLDLVERIPGSPPLESLNQTLRDRLRPLLHGLLRTGGLREATFSWREIALGEVRNCFKLHIPLFMSEDDKSAPDPDQGAALANHLQSLTHEEFMTLIRSVYSSLLNCVEGLQTQNKVLLEVLEATQPTKFVIDMPALQEELADILSSAAELSNARASTIISSRSEQTNSLPLPDFLNLFNESWNFVLKCEIICRRMIVGLRGVIVSQSKTFLQAFHQDHISQSAKLVEDELWNPAEVPPRYQRTVAALVESAVRNPPELLLEPPPTPVSPTMNGSPPKSPARVSKHVRIEDRSFFAVSATLETLCLLMDYLRIISNLSMLTTDTMSRVIEFFKSFNSRTCQVVLGAGAMRSAGLKNITAKHLALASQSLSIMIALIPYVRETFRRHLSEKQAVMLVEFDKLKRDYQEHQNEIHTKLIAIMGDRLTVHIRSLQEIDWNVAPPQPKVNLYMETLVKETVTLHKVLSRYLPVAVVEYVMSQVFAAINHGLTGEYVGIVLPDQSAKDRLLLDVTFLHENLSVLKNVAGASTAMLTTVVMEKSTTIQPARTTTNERIRGMLTRQSSVPTPPEQDDTVTPRPDSPLPVQPTEPNGMNGDTHGLTSPPLPALPDGEERMNGMGAGVEAVPEIPQITVNGNLES